MENEQTYTPKDWIDDFHYIQTRVAVMDRSNNLPATLAYFERKYGPHSDDRVARLTGALRYFERNDGEFDDPAFSIVSRFGKRVPSLSLWLALLAIYNGAGRDQMDFNVNLDGVREMARGLAKLGY